MTQEEAEREKQSVDGRAGSIGAHRRVSRTSTDKMTHKAGPQIPKPVAEDASEDAIPNRTLMAVRSPSPDKGNAVAGATLPVVEEDGEANSREESMHKEKLHQTKSDHPTELLSDGHPPSSPPPTLPKDSQPLDQQLPPIPHLARLSMSETLAAQAAQAPPQV